MQIRNNQNPRPSRPSILPSNL